MDFGAFLRTFFFKNFPTSIPVILTTDLSFVHHVMYHDRGLRGAEKGVQPTYKLLNELQILKKKTIQS